MSRTAAPALSNSSSMSSAKTKLETNLQSASLLPHYNTFEARAMRVVISDLPPEYLEEESLSKDVGIHVTDEKDNRIDFQGTSKDLPVSDVRSR